MITMRFYKVTKLLFRAFQQPTTEDAAIYFENAFKTFKPSPQVQRSIGPAYAIDKDQQVQRILFEKTDN